MKQIEQKFDVFTGFQMLLFKKLSLKVRGYFSIRSFFLHSGSPPQPETYLFDAGVRPGASLLLMVVPENSAAPATDTW